MSCAYMIVTEDINDPLGIDAYGQQALPTILQHGGRLVVATEKPEILEGEWHGQRTVVLEFDSVEAAKGWYNSPDYQAVIGLRHAAATSNFILVPGFEFPEG